jgi:membrane-associated protease RseP (regulator of RpoE activity)
MQPSYNAIFYILIFWLSIYLFSRFYLRGRENIVINPIYIMIKKKISEGFLEGTKDKRIFKLISALFIILAVVSMVLFYYFVVPLSLARFSGQGAQGGLTPIIPGVTISGESLIYLLINIGIAATIHEFSHALIARSRGIKIKSAGFILAIILPMAFVEPDDSDFKKASLKDKLSVYSAGPSSNLILAFILLGLLSLFASMGGGVLITSVDQGSPAERAGLEPGYIIKAVNGTVVKNLKDFQSALGDYREKELVFVLEVLKPDGSTTIVTIHKLSNETKLGIGIANAPPQGVLGKLVTPISVFLVWGYIVNFSLAIINAAPMFITDGARMISDLITEKLKGDKGKAVNFFIQVLTMLILLFSLSLQPIG